MSTAGEMENEAEAAANPGGRCAACRYLRRRCDHDCVLAPYFPASQPHRYACVHRVFGASNVTRLLQNLPVQERAQAADAIATEAEWRAHNKLLRSKSSKPACRCRGRMCTRSCRLSRMSFLISVDSRAWIENAHRCTVDGPKYQPVTMSFQCSRKGKDNELPLL